MNYSAEFDISLKLGKELEDKLSGILKGDFVAEVKRDYFTQHTGNVAIEYQSRGKPSGIAITKAPYWIIGIENGPVIIAETEQVKTVAREYFNKGHIKAMGDNNTSKAVLIPLKDYVSKLIKMDLF